MLRITNQLAINALRDILMRATSMSPCRRLEGFLPRTGGNANQENTALEKPQTQHGTPSRLFRRRFHDKEYKTIPQLCFFRLVFLASEERSHLLTVILEKYNIAIQYIGISAKKFRDMKKLYFH